MVSGLDPVMIQQLARVPGVFASDKIHLAKHTHGPQRDVLEVPMGVETTKRVPDMPGILSRK